MTRGAGGGGCGTGEGGEERGRAGRGREEVSNDAVVRNVTHNEKNRNRDQQLIRRERFE